MDSDDFWLPQKLERQFDELGDRLGQISVFACTNVLISGQGKLYNMFPPSDRHLSEYFLVDNCSFQTSSIIVPTALARQVRFDERLRHHQDWDFVLRLVAAGAKPSYLHEALVYYDARNDIRRVSAQKSVEATLFWFQLAGPLVTKLARQQYYLSSCFYAHRRKNPIAAAYTLIKYTVSFPGGIPNMIKYVVRAFKGRVFSAATS